MRAFPFSGAGQPGGRHGRRARRGEPTARDVFDEVDEALGQNLFRLMREGRTRSLKLTENAQPAIMAHSLAVFRALTKDGGVDLAKAANFVAGHSLGEYSALCCGVVRSGDYGEAAQASRSGDAASGSGRVGAMAALLGADLALAAEDRRSRGAGRGLHRRQRQRSDPRS